MKALKKCVSRRAIAEALGIRTPSVGKMDREGRGPGTPIYISKRHVVYDEAEVREFFRDRGVWEPVWVAPQEQQKRAAERRERAARTRTRPAARLGSTEAPSEAESPPVVAEREEGEP